ncbi:MAG: sarcosine oxidase subunit delta, partial [Shimia sp.]
MQIFTCPFCGPRPETEFHFVGELGKVRPDTTSQI